MRLDTAEVGGSRAIESAIRAANRDGRPALTAFLTAGYPQRDRFAELLEAVAVEADVVEVGVPFSDPMADGVTIQRASRAALNSGVSLPWILDEIDRADPAAPVLLMSYLNPLLAFGHERLGGAAARAGVAGFIIPDLPVEESRELEEALEPHGLGIVQFVTPVTPAARMSELCARSRGFVYAVTRTGTTGGSFDPAGAAEMLARVRRISALPVQAGFGVREPEQVRELAPHVDGLIVGSALVEKLEAGENPAAFLRSLRNATRGDRR
ncbi:MAG: tryptophan synthase subunit alpha [marine benthic group bacterium]|nr:tryptophan synthase subunit alpha [Gemmatimonadota bacterium]